MKVNIGSADRIIRIVLGLALVVLLFAVDGPWRWVGLLGFVLLGTAAVNFCPIWAACGISTNKALPAKQE